MGAQDLTVFVPTRALALRGAEILDIPLASTSAGCGRLGGTITLCPPLVITRAECDRIVDTLGQALATL